MRARFTAERAQSYDYADRMFAVGDTYNMTKGHQETIDTIWLDRKYGDCFHIEIVGKISGTDTTPGDFYRRVVSKQGEQA